MGTQNRGFASMDRDKQRRIASQGGKSAHAKGTAHTWNASTASEAGRKGGLATAAKRRQDTAPVENNVTA